jgi:RNA polymerase sigma-70 factor, ECF subfamily
LVKECSELCDNSVAIKVVNGDKEAFGVLVKRFSPRLRCFLSRRVPNPSDVEDIIQDTFLKAYLNIASFDPKYKFSCWLFTIASRTAMNNARDQRLHTVDIKYEIVSQISQPDRIMMDCEEKDGLWQRARDLDPRQYSALYLKYIEDFSTEEIAATMNTTKINVRVLLHRARNNLIKMTRLKTGK